MLSGMIHAGFEGSDYWRKNSYDPLTGNSTYITCKGNIGLLNNDHIIKHFHFDWYQFVLIIVLLG